MNDLKAKTGGQTSRELGDLELERAVGGLNPQPLPPRQALNPQPLPPGFIAQFMLHAQY
jgi:hypothetical protein